MTKQSIIPYIDISIVLSTEISVNFNLYTNKPNIKETFFENSFSIDVDSNCESGRPTLILQYLHNRY